MAENNWLLQDGRSILVQFDTPASPTNWGWFGNRSSGEGLEFAAPEIAWTNHAWLRGGQYIMAAEVGGGSIDCTIVTSQAQGVVATLLLALSSTLSSGQAQSTSGTLQLLIVATITTQQCESVVGTYLLNISSTLTTSQIQSAILSTILTGQFKVWTGVMWKAGSLRYWNGSSWISKSLKYWNGTSWL